MFRLAVVGYRNYHNYYQFEQTLLHWLYQHNFHYVNQIMIVTGDATGTDQMACQFANANNVSLQKHYALWQQYGHSAGPIRNSQILDHADHLIAFLSPDSKGTRNIIRQAQKRGTAVTIYDARPELVSTNSILPIRSKL